MKNDCRVGAPNTPMAQLTEFGWTLTGSPSQISTTDKTLSSVFHVSVEPSLSNLLSTFWEIEEVSSKPLLSQAEQDCETHYQDTTKRDHDGSYWVELPFSKACSFPDSRNIAVACLLRSEKSRARKLELNKAYHDFMDEYLALGHMEEVPEAELHNQEVYYMPHHAVVKPDDPSKIRVVFNASQKSSNGISLNDCLHPGNKLQSDIIHVLTNWRFHAVVFTADIVKMFRQIFVNKSDSDYQRIVWRKNTNSPIRDYRLKTVTYGTTSAPFLAIRTLHQIADDEQHHFPAAANVLRTQTYIDDIFAGADTLDAAQELKSQLVDMLASANIALGKWAANHNDLLRDLSSSEGKPLQIESVEAVSTLGLNWKPGEDSFFFKVNMPSLQSHITKRTILSEVARLFDPMGWLSPILIKAKILLQDLWIRNIDWDSEVPTEVKKAWLAWRSELPFVSAILIPRFFQTTSCSVWTLHGFSDASDRAYSAALYIVLPGGISRLIASKTKVAPVKTLSIPKLELSGALLLSRLTKHFLAGSTSQPTSLYCWTDSTVVLSWLKDHASRWKPFVANRVSEITSSIPQAQWNHVRSKDNPADCASRGLTPEQLKNFDLWWHGPTWLSLPPQNWPTSQPLPINKDALIEERKSVNNVTVAVKTSTHILDVLKSCSTLKKALRVIIYCLRWRSFISRKEKERKDTFISAEEWSKGRLALYAVIQLEHFPAELKCLQNSAKPSKLNPLGRLLPFLDQKGLIRVGGRLQNSFLSYSEKHPIILPKDNYFVKLLVEEAHALTLHGGVQLMISYLNRTVWILHGRRLVKSIANKCVKCVRFAQLTRHQQTAPLPKYRLDPCTPFELTGVDYAGPISVRCSKGRGIKTEKGYIAIFICMVVKAVHLEIVTDLSTPTFLAAYHRLAGRRGYPAVMYSDNAKNFIGAAEELKQLFEATSSMSAEVAAYVAKFGTRWSFIPPRTPHFGGLWEAAVKSFKHHYYRVIGESTLTYEELLTLNCQIEACLNSRPLCPLSSEGNDLVALTPGHFLIGKPLMAPPEPSDNIDIQSNYNSRWKLIQAMRNNFWYRWKKEVLYHLQQRNKWLDPVPSPQINDLVIVKDEQTPPTQWPLGRVIAIHPGKDNLNRVLTIKTQKEKPMTRDLSRIIALPKDEEAVAVHATTLKYPLMAGGQKKSTLQISSTNQLKKENK